MEILAVHAALVGGTTSVIKQLMDCKTTDEAIVVIEQNNLQEQVFASVLEKMRFHINYRTKGKLQVEIMMFSAKDKVILKTQGSMALAEKLGGTTS